MGLGYSRGQTHTSMMDNNPAPDIMLKMIHCSCSDGCNTFTNQNDLDVVVGSKDLSAPRLARMTTKNMNHAPVLDENED
jgi:hypothetical protein